MSTRGRPWLKFYGADWRSDIPLRSCSAAARGLWVDLLTLMHEATPYGHLTIGGKAATTRQLATILGGTENEAKRSLFELEKQGVFSRTEDGVIYSRRMIRDQAKAERDQLNGRGGGNPNVTGGVKPPDNPGVNPPVKGGDKAQKPEARIQRSKRPAKPARIGLKLTDAPLPPPPPTLNDPPEVWLPFGTGREVDAEGQTHAVLGGYRLDAVAELCCEAAGHNGYRKGQNWTPLLDLLREGFDLHEHILPTVRRVARRPSFQLPNQPWHYFAKIVREEREAA